MVTQEQERAAVSAAPAELFVGGAWRPATRGESFAVEDPSTGATLAEVANATAADGLDALDAAAGRQEAWAAHPPRERGEILRRAFEAIVARADELALLTTLEMGKPVSDSRAEVLYAAEFFRWFAEEAVRVGGRAAVAPDGQGRLWTMRQPVGPCLLITPWNFPLAMGARKIAPAIAAGCTMVVKPAHQTPLSMLALAEVLQEAGLPDGVLNVVPTTDPQRLVAALLGDPRLRKLSFTGSTEVGRLLLREAAGNVLRTSMELGGNAPFIVFGDADVERAVDGAMVAKMRNVGQACTAANRFYVDESVAEEFTTRLAERFGALRIGRGAHDADVGPLVDARQLAKVSALVDDALRAGARCEVGGRAGDGAGCFYLPTVLSRVPPTARLLGEEIFGPVAPIVTFGTEAEALTAANEGDLGLAAYVFTRDLDRAVRVVERLEAGMVAINQGMVSNPAAPFGGVKQSGLGREGGVEGIDEYLAVKVAQLTVTA